MSDAVTSKVQHITALDFDVTEALKQLENLKSRIDTITAKLAAHNWTINAVINNAGDFKRFSEELEKIQKQYTELQIKVQNFQENLEKAGQAGDESVGSLANTIERRLIKALENAGKAAYEAAKDVEDSMVEISRVLNLTGEQSDGMRAKLFGLGNDFGRSFGDVSDIALRFAQAGNDMNDTLTLTETALLALNTAELDSTQATQSLIGILSQWGMQAEDLITVVDKLNYTADHNAITTQDLVDALLKASSMAKTAGMSFDDTVGSLTALKVASGAAGKEVGNAFKSILAYIQRPESLKTFEGMGIKVFADETTGALLPMMDILKSMSKKWNSSAEAQQNMVDTLMASGDAAQMMSEEWAIATDSLDEYREYQEAAAAATDKTNDAESRAQAQAAAGVFRRNYYISLMESFADAVRISGDLVNAEGHSMEENSRYMETLTAKTEQLKAALTELAVAAADAGFMDLAKSALELATKLAKLTAEGKNIIPVLTAAGGAIVALKANSIVDGFGKGISAVKGLTTALGTATTASAGLAAGLGVVGAAVAVVSTVIAVIKAAEAAERAEREETIRQGEAAAETYSKLEKLSGKYEELSSVASRTAEQEEAYKETQQEIISLLGDRANALKGLKEGTEEYTEALRDQIEREQEANLAKVHKAAEAAETEFTAAFDKETSRNTLGFLSFDKEYEKNVYDAVKDSEKLSGMLKESSDGIVTLDYRGESMLETYANLGEVMEAFDKKHHELLLESDEAASSLLNNEEYKQAAGSYENLTEAVEKYLAVVVQYRQAKYLADNKMPETIQEQETMNKAIIDGIDPTGRLADKITGLITVYGTIDQQKVDFFKAFNSSEFEDVKNKLTELAEANLLTASSFEDTASKNEKFRAEMDKIGYSAEDASAVINEMVQAENALASASGTAADETENITSSVQELGKTIESAEKGISSLNKYMQTLSEGNGLTADQVMELCDTYGLLAEQFTLTENGYIIELSALEELREAQKQTAITARMEQAGYTSDVLEEILARIQGYTSEVESIKTVAEAQAALTELRTAYTALEKTGMGITTDEGYAAWKKERDELAELIGTTEDYAAVLEKMESLQNELYDNMGKTFGKGSSGSSAAASAEKTKDAVDELSAAFEHLNSLGAYTLDEQIGFYEKLRREVASTEGQYKKLETTLQKLYAEQVKSNLDSVKSQYEKKISDTKDYYDKEIDTAKKAADEEYSARQKYYDDELSRLKSNLNAQISAAKSSYEEKKKYADKYYDGQINALKALKDAEISNIKAVYNAQISALEKIKAARQSERNEEDYQDKRSELLEQLSYWEQRTGTEAVENIANIKKQIAELDKDRNREREDEETDSQIAALQEQLDNEVAAAQRSYDSRIAALEASQKKAQEIYETSYSTEVRMLEDRLEKETKALEAQRDKELESLKKQKEKKLAYLEEQKNAAVQAEKDKWEKIQEMFSEENQALIAAAGQFAPKIYEQFEAYFLDPFSTSLDDLAAKIRSLDSVKSSIISSSGKMPSNGVTSTVAGTSTYSGSTAKSTIAVSSGSASGKTSDSGKYSKDISAIKKKPVQAAAGGKTSADGLVMLHKNELIINPPATKKLEELAADYKKTKAVIDPEFIKSVKRMTAFYSSGGSSSTSNAYSTSNDNRRQVTNNFYAPLQNIEKVEDAADAEAMSNSIERKLMREINSKI